MKWTGSDPITADFRISLPNSRISSVRIGRKAARVTPKSRWGMTTAEVEVPLGSGKTTAVTVDYQKREGKPPEFAREKYRYIVPKRVPSYDMVYWENEPRKRNAEDLRTFDLLEGKVNFRLISAFNPNSPDWLRPFLIKANGKINSPVFLMGTNSIASSLKYAKWWGNPDLSKLFKEYMHAGGAIVAVKTGEKSSDLFGDLLEDSEYFIVPSEATTVIPDEEIGSQIFQLLGIGGNEGGFNTSGAYIYRNMVVIGRPEKEEAAGAILARRVGKGFFMTILGDLTYYQMATVAQNLANPKRLSEINRIISSSRPKSVPGAFEDFAKDNSYSDIFDSFKDGSVGVPVWLPLHGNWRMQGGEYHLLNTNGYDFISTANARIEGDYVVEARMRLVENIFEGGFVFNLPSRFSKGSSQMVRFCGHETLWCGPFSPGGGFTLENSLSSKLKVRDEKWHTLKLVVRNSEGLYDIAVDGKDVAKGLRLTNIPGNGCYIGLVACRGHVAFEDLKVYPLRRK
jgi:hypothetical protein